MLEGLYGAEQRQDLPQKRKRNEAIVIDDDDEGTDAAKKRSAIRHKGTGIIGEYMKEGRKLAANSNGLPVDLAKGMYLLFFHFDTRLVDRSMLIWMVKEKGKKMKM